MSKEHQFEKEVLEGLEVILQHILGQLRFQEEVLNELRYHRRLLEAVLRLERGHPRLAHIKIRFQPQGVVMAPTIGPLTLTTAGQVATASVQGFDQSGNPMPASFTLPPVTFSVDDTTGAVVKAVDNGDGTATVTAVANGTANLTAKATSAEGIALSDSEPITVAIGVTPVLSSIKIAFAT